MSKDDKFWERYADMQKISKIIQHLMEWEYYTSWNDYQRKYGKQEYELGAGKPFTTPTPVAFWDGEWRVFSPDHEKLDVFDPLHSFDDAWQVVRAINKPGNYGNPHDRYAAFIEALEKMVGSTMLFDLFYCDPESDLQDSEHQHLTPERICDAALEAIRKVEEEFKQGHAEK